jgi:hypothetical protein
MVAAAGPTASGAKHRMLPQGSWGGDHITMTVKASGADLEFDCATGNIAAPIELDRHGSFTVRGQFHAEHGGPVRRDEETSIANATYAGKLQGDSLTLIVTVGDDKQPVGSFTLSKDAAGRLMKCR